MTELKLYPYLVTYELKMLGGNCNFSKMVMEVNAKEACRKVRFWAKHELGRRAVNCKAVRYEETEKGEK